VGLASHVSYYLELAHSSVWQQRRPALPTDTGLPEVILSKFVKLGGPRDHYERQASK